MIFQNLVLVVDCLEPSLDILKESAQLDIVKDPLPPRPLSFTKGFRSNTKKKLDHQIITFFIFFVQTSKKMIFFIQISNLPIKVDLLIPPFHLFGTMSLSLLGFVFGSLPLVKLTKYVLHSIKTRQHISLVKLPLNQNEDSCVQVLQFHSVWLFSQVLSLW